MAEMGAIRMFMKMKAFDKIPLEGSISYKDLASSLDAEEAMISTLFNGSRAPSLTALSAHGMDDGCDWYVHQPLY
jgi:hypothetical protein